MNLIELVSGIFKPAAELIDELHTSEEERLAQKAKLLDIQATVVQQALDYEKDITMKKADIIIAEAKSDSWIAKNWRPMIMLAFGTIVCLHSFDLVVNDMAPQMWTLLQIGLGGYVVGRSGEKIVKTLKDK